MSTMSNKEGECVVRFCWDAWLPTFQGLLLALTKFHTASKEIALVPSPIRKLDVERTRIRETSKMKE